MRNLFYLSLSLYYISRDILDGQGGSRMLDNNLKENFPTRIIVLESKEQSDIPKLYKTMRVRAFSKIGTDKILRIAAISHDLPWRK